jgi:mannose/fructose/N-acetylgalactosamine-specific phosphotransferase system component IIC
MDAAVPLAKTLTLTSRVLANLGFAMLLTNLCEAQCKWIND